MSVAANLGKKNALPRQVKAGKAGKGVPVHFAFGARRGPVHGLRRLFVPLKSPASPIFEPDGVRPHAILRVVSSCP